jgi:hypothetical protein
MFTACLYKRWGMPKYHYLRRWGLCHQHTGVLITETVQDLLAVPPLCQAQPPLFRLYHWRNDAQIPRASPASPAQRSCARHIRWFSRSVPPLPLSRVFQRGWRRDAQIPSASLGKPAQISHASSQVLNLILRLLRPRSRLWIEQEPREEDGAPEFDVCSDARASLDSASWWDVEQWGWRSPLLVRLCQVLSLVITV